MSKHIYTLLILCFSVSVYSQIKVDETKNVGIGIDPQPTVKVSIENDTKNYGLNINSLVYGKSYGLKVSTVSTGNHVYGITNHTSQTQQSGKHTYGLNNQIINILGHTGRVYAIYNKVEDGTGGLVYGLYNFISNSDQQSIGTYNRITATAANDKTLSGTYNYFKASGSGLVYGFRNLFANATGGSGDMSGLINSVSRYASTGIIRGVYNNIYHDSDSDAYGVFNQLTEYGAGDSYGVRNYLSPKNTGDVYGSYNYINNGNSHSGTTYGVYSNVTGGGGSGEKWAGLFEGDVCINGTLLHSSDLKLKSNIQNVSSSLSQILKLAPKTYNHESSDTEKTQYGFIAQELEKIFPDLVREVSTPNHTIKLSSSDISKDEDSESDGLEMETIQREEGSSVKVIEYTALIPILVKSMQEQQDQIETLKKELQALKNK